MKKPRLPVHEWMAVVAISLFFTTLTVCILLAPKKTESFSTSLPHYLVDQKIEVILDGAVKNPGIHTATRGMRMEELLREVALTEDADLKRLKLKTKLRPGQKIHVPHLKTITIQLSGAVKTAGPVVLPKGARLEDLIERIAFEPHADLAKLRRKRKLKEGEVVHVTSIK